MTRSAHKPAKIPTPFSASAERNWCGPPGVGLPECLRCAVRVAAVLKLEGTNVKARPSTRVHVTSWAAIVQMVPVHGTPQLFAENSAKTRCLTFAQFGSIDDRVTLKASCYLIVGALWPQVAEVSISKTGVALHVHPGGGLVKTYGPAAKRGVNVLPPSIAIGISWLGKILVIQLGDVVVPNFMAACR